MLLSVKCQCWQEIFGVMVMLMLVLFLQLNTVFKMIVRSLKTCIIIALTEFHLLYLEDKRQDFNTYICHSSKYCVAYVKMYK